MTTKTKKSMKKPAKAAVKAKPKAKPVAKTLKKVVKTKTVKAAKAPAKKQTNKTKPVTKKPMAKTAPAKKAAPVAKTQPVKPMTKVVVKPVAVAPKAAVVAMPAKPMMRPQAPMSVAPRMGTPMNKPMMQPQRPGMNPMQARAMAARPANDTPIDFRTGDYVVYPAHGVGTIEGIETQTIAGMTVTLFAIAFEKDRMRLKIPVAKAQSSGLRKLSTGDRLKDAPKTLQGKAKVKRTMWSRRAQEYEAKINSGDPVQIAEVLRDLRRPKDDTEQSYSERQIYQSALERLAREVAAVQKIAETKAVEHLETVLSQAA